MITESLNNSPIATDWKRSGGSAYIYFVQWQNDPDFLKIGMTKNMASRMATFITYSPSRLIVLGIMECKSWYKAELLEKSLHAFFKEERHRDEWFKNSERIQSYIKTDVDKKITREIYRDFIRQYSGGKRASIVLAKSDNLTKEQIWSDKWLLYGWPRYIKQCRDFVIWALAKDVLSTGAIIDYDDAEDLFTKRTIYNTVHILKEEGIITKTAKSGKWRLTKEGLMIFKEMDEMF